MTTGAFRTTPTSAMEVLVNIPPLNLLVIYEALNANYRFAISDKKEIRDLVDDELEKMNNVNPLTKITLSDHMCVKYNFEINYAVEEFNRGKWLNKEIIFEPNDVIWYTDGSKMNTGTGSGLHCKDSNICTSLGVYATVFQAEVHAIELCARECLKDKLREKRIFILSDSQAAIQALCGCKITSRLVWDCTVLLKELAKENIVKLIWTPGHSGIEGNEKADELAREGSINKLHGPEPFCGIALSTVKEGNKCWLKNKMQEVWSNSKRMKYAKIMMPTIKQNRANDFLNLSRKQSKTISRYFTGHGGFMKHLMNLRISNDNKCRICKEDEETAYHLLFNCRALDRNRIKCFGKPTLNTNDLDDYTMKDFIKFINMNDTLGKI